MKSAINSDEMKKDPIGIIDSGLGGLTVWRELVDLMPHEDYLYFGDSGCCPYGSKNPEEILERVQKIVDILLKNGCKLIVIACNAITASTVDDLRKNYPIPFIGMEPAIKPALKATRTKAIGVLATERTLNGKLFCRTKSTYGNGITIVEQVGHGLVERVENLEFASRATIDILKTYLAPMLAQNIDALVLGCTHYPFLEPAIRQIVGDRVAIIHPAPAVARQTLNILEQWGLACKEPVEFSGKSTFLTTGAVANMRQILSRIQPARHDVRSLSI